MIKLALKYKLTVTSGFPGILFYSFYFWSCGGTRRVGVKTRRVGSRMFIRVHVRTRRVHAV